MIYCPKGLHDSARGFNPGNRPKPHRALKGRHIDWPGSVLAARFSVHVDWRLVSVWRSEIGRYGARSPAPLQGASPGWKAPGVETPGRVV